MFELKHYGVKGMKWGVRRYQNADGTLTPLGKQQNKYRNNIAQNRLHIDDVNDIVRSLSDKEKNLLGAPLDEDWIEKDSDPNTLATLGKRFIHKNGDIPISFLEIYTNGGHTGQIAIATRSGDEYRGKGYASEQVEAAIKWVDRYGKNTIDELEWIAEKSNAGSNNLAKKYGFTQVETPSTDAWKDYNRYIRKTNK